MFVWSIQLHWGILKKVLQFSVLCFCVCATLGNLNSLGPRYHRKMILSATINANYDDANGCNDSPAGAQSSSEQATRFFSFSRWPS